MNDLPIDPCSPNSAENMPASQGALGKAVAFLKRDVKSFFLRDNKASSETVEKAVAPTAPTAPAQPVEPLVDFNRLPELAFRREVLDWRDDFQAAVTKTMARLHDAFIEQVNAELGNTSLLRIVFARPSDEVLQRSFVRIVRRPLIATLRQEEAKLDEIARKWALLGTVDLSFNLRRLNAECESLHDIGFKPAQKNLISSRIQALLLEPAGMADYFRHQGMGLSTNLLEAKKS
jgi:hypothetical protein